MLYEVITKDIQANQVPFRDLRGEAERQGHVLAFDGDALREPVARAGVGEAAGDDRDVGADDDLRLLVVGGQQSYNFV